MGISGLLPLLKSVQKPTHLSELAGKTIAVDAYVWLHRGAYACATELVTGKYTTKYVDYAMHRVRLLQYHKITPYVVFDGGPLPAKKGTEVERKRKRDENLVLARALAQQGCHSQAREHYVKCVDITPQIAFQFIKALRAEQVPYVVAPYEADAQLFHLESTGLAHGILTEDSDLLIFGTQLLLLKLDSSTAMCTAITACTLASNSPADLALHGWGVKELRECAMLSGCDYIEGVRGVGLKTAGKLLRRWGTVDRALRALRMDGKTVEGDWEARMRRAEVGFLNQRVWDPRASKIIYLTEPDWAAWDGEREKFVGEYIEPELASRLARGDVDPITLEPMVDIMPSFQPSKHPLRPRPLTFKDSNRADPAADSDPTTNQIKGSLLQYFIKQPKSTASPVLPPTRRVTQVGRASGKRTLAAEYDHEAAAAKRLKLADENIDNGVAQSSKFFAATTERLLIQHAFDDDKENLEELEDEDPVLGVVEQEQGYVSPGSPFSSPDRAVATNRCTTPDFSSPIQTHGPVRQMRDEVVTEAEDAGISPCGRRQGVALPRQFLEDDDDAVWGSEDGRITSPPMGSVRTPRTRRKIGRVVLMDGPGVPGPDTTDVFTCDTPRLYPHHLDIDFRDMLGGASGSSDADTVQHSPVTPLDESPLLCAIAQSDDVIEDDEEVEAAVQLEEQHKVVGAGWEKKYSNPHGRVRPGRSAVDDSVKGKGKARARPTLRRWETMRTPLRTTPFRQSGLLEHNVNPKLGRSDHVSLAVIRRSSPVRFASDSIRSRTGVGAGEDGGEPVNAEASLSSQEAVDLGTVSNARAKLQAYRFK